ncbi:FMN2, partial [Symbiodinium sp. CCMP2456]
EVAAALLKLDAVVLSPSHLNVIKEHASPQPAQVSQLEECRKEHPTVPFALPEEYMWHISRVPAYQARISCWTFVLSYKETTGACSAMLGEFQLIEEAIHQSRALR